MKTGIFGASVLCLLQLAAAQPHRHREHRHLGKRAYTTEVVTVTQDLVDAIIFVDHNGNVVSTSYIGVTVPTPQPEVPAISVPEPTTTSVEPVIQEAAVESPVPVIAETPAAEPSTTQTPPPPVESSSLVVEAQSEETPATSSPAEEGFIGSNAGLGVTYSVYTTAGGPCKSKQQVLSDFQMLGAFSLIRIHGTDCEQVDNVVAAARSTGKKVMLGVFNIADLDGEIQAIINGVGNDWRVVDTVSIGNEVLFKGEASVGELVNAINAGRTKLRAAGYKGPVVSVDETQQVLNHPEVCQASDYAAINCHAYFATHVNAPEAGSYVRDRVQAVSRACGGKRVVVTESGWPRAGDARATVQNHQAAISSLKEAFSSDMYLFSAFDAKFRLPNPALGFASADNGGVEPWFGLIFE